MCVCVNNVYVRYHRFLYLIYVCVLIMYMYDIIVFSAISYSYLLFSFMEYISFTVYHPHKHRECINLEPDF